MFNQKALFHRHQELLIRISAALLLLASTAGLLSQTVFAQTTYVIIDGSRVVVHTTSATNPADVLNEAGLELGQEDTYTTQTGTGVSEITVQRGQTVLIDNCGKEVRVDTYGESVESLLTRLGISIDGTTVSAPLDADTYDGMHITISRVVRSLETYTVDIPFETTYCEDKTIPAGQEIVLVEGTDGQKQITASVVYENGLETSRVPMSTRIIQEPVTRIIARGTGPVETESDAPVIADGLIRLSTGEVLTYTKVVKMKATAYTNTDEGCNEWTATGTRARVGAIAVDPRVIPYGTRMFIVSNDGEYIYGIATAEDCGGGIKGNRIDLYFDTTAECFQFGIRNCSVYILSDSD